MPSSSSDESADSSRVRRKDKNDSVKKSREEKSSSKDYSEKKKKDKKEHGDSTSRQYRHHGKSPERQQEKKSKHKKWRSSSDSDSDSPSPKTQKRKASSPEPKRSLHKDKPLQREADDVSAKRHHGDRSEKDNRFSSGSTASGDYDDYRKKPPYSSYKNSSRDNDNGRERFDRRGDNRQQYGPSDRPKGNYNRDEKIPPWKRRRDEDEDEGEKEKRPAWATNRVIEHAKQIQNRKLLWQRPSAAATSTTSSESVEDAPSSSKPPAASSSSAPPTKWANMLAAAGSDEKSVDKFKRLMGIRDDAGGTTAVSSDAVEAERNRQEALYRDLDQQYNIARSVTHTGRGKGLGFF